MRSTCLLAGDLRAFSPGLRQADGNRLFRVGYLLVGLAALELAVLVFVHGVLHFALRFLAVLACHDAPRFRNRELGHHAESTSSLLPKVNVQESYRLRTVYDE